MQSQRSPVRSRRCPATVVPFGDEPGRLALCPRNGPRRKGGSYVAPRVAARSPAAPRRRVSLAVALVGCTIFLLITMIMAVAIGSVSLSPGAVWGVIVDHLAGHPGNSVADAIGWEIRLPRVLDRKSVV